VVAISFSKDDEIYTQNALADLMGHVCKFAIEAAQGEDGVVNPSRIVLVFVNSGNTDALWNAFGHSVIGVPLEDAEWNWQGGKHWRFDSPATIARVRKALAHAESESLNATRFRLEAHRLGDPLLLPGRNFVLPGGEVLAARYRDFLGGSRSIDQIDEEVPSKKFRFDELRRFYSKMGGKNHLFAFDARGLVFAKGRIAQDGAHHLIPEGETLTIARLRRELEGRFRFGSPLQPPGFQHDVQLPDGKLMEHEAFMCTDNGPVTVSGDHTNIYGNDVVRGNLTRG
jgi:hypothetical protein